MGRGRTINFVPDTTDGQQTYDQTSETYYVENGNTVTAGDWVYTDVSGTTWGRGRSVKRGDDLTAVPKAITGFKGIALETVAGPGPVRVATPSPRGTIVPSANVADAVAAGDPLTASATVDGRLDVATIGTHHIVAFALTDGNASNQADIELKPA